jgi:imidazolonepropionase-like amidohydrolase
MAGVPGILATSTPQANACLAVPAEKNTMLEIKWVCMLVAACGVIENATLLAQAPTTLKGNPLVGLIDFHVHSGPDSFTRSTTDFEIARIARGRGMAALVLKNHFTMTADRAMLAERITGQRCFGGIVLNRAVGGLNAEAIRRMVTFTGDRGRVVWLPTFDAQNHVRRFKEDRPSVAVVRDGKPVEALKEVFAVCAKHDLVLETGHSSAAECLVLLEAARKAGIKKLLVTHGMADPIGMTVPQMKHAARLGAKIECVWMTNLTGPGSHLASMRHWKKISTADYAKAIRAVGVEHFVLSSDLGQYLNPIPTDGLKSFVLGLSEAGFSRKEILRMCRETPAALLGLDLKISK